MVCLSKQHDFRYEGRVQEKTPYSPKFRYQRDPIGNRITSTTSESGSPVIRNYTSNNLNQYTAIDNPAVSPTHDDDGNLTSDDDFDTYVWNAENRLVSAIKAGVKKISFLHDYMGRRVERKLFSWSGTDWTLEEHEKYVWDDWNRIEILDGMNSNALKKTLAWGLDITGDLTAAGGVGALLSVTTFEPSATTYYALYDANGNVGQYLDSTGAIVAKYEYSPEPGFSLKEGTLADDLAAIASFSTKPYDKDVDAFRYQLRILKDSRWISRDPIEEEGGYNLYAMVSNDLVNIWDRIGGKGESRIEEMAKVKLLYEKEKVVATSNPKLFHIGYLFRIHPEDKCCYKYGLQATYVADHVVTEKSYRAEIVYRTDFESNPIAEVLDEVLSSDILDAATGTGIPVTLQIASKAAKFATEEYRYIRGTYSWKEDFFKKISPRRVGGTKYSKERKRVDDSECNPKDKVVLSEPDFSGVIWSFDTLYIKPAKYDIEWKPEKERLQDREIDIDLIR